MSFEYVYTPDEIEKELFEIRDVKDYPVLYTAIIENIDILITGRILLILISRSQR